MKQVVIVFAAVIVAASSFLIACSEASSIYEPNSGNPRGIAFSQKENQALFIVSPSGNYDDDSFAIQKALDDAVAAGPGSTVQLTAGTFYLRERIEIDGFDGFFTGAGEQQTIITTHDPIQFDPADPDEPSLFTFRHGFVRMSDMTFRVTLPKPAIGVWEDYYGCLPNIVHITGSSLQDVPEAVEEASASFSNVSFIGAAGHAHDDPYDSSYGGWNVWACILVGPEQPIESWPPSPYFLHGRSTIMNCDFQHIAMGVMIYECIDGVHIIGGNASTGNVFHETCSNALLAANCIDTSIEASYNRLEDITWSGLVAVQGSHWFPPSLLTTMNVVFRHNDIEMVTNDPEWAWDGISIGDWANALGGGPKIEATVSNNSVFLNNSPWGGIAFEGANEILVTNNKVWGKGFSGIYGGGYGLPSYGGILKGNNVNQIVADVAPIWLGIGTSNFTVVGGTNRTNVFDEGTGNVLTGVNNMQGNAPGQTIKDAMSRKADIMRLFRSRK